LLQGATATAGLLTLGQGHRIRTTAAQTDGLPEPEDSGIEHIVWVMMENRSFDHFLGWLEGADGRQAGVTYPDRMGVMQPTHRLAPDFQGCGHPDPDHSYLGSRIAYHDRAVDGWLQTGANDPYAIGYYTDADLAFLGQAAPAWTVCDHYFASVMGESFPNRFHQHCAQTDRLRNTDTLTTLPTIWDRLADARLEGRYYVSDAPFLGLWGTKYHRRVLKHTNHDNQDQHGLPVRWECETIPTIFRRTPCWSRAMIPAVLSSYKRYPC